MDKAFIHYVSLFITSCILVIRNTSLLIVSPYKTMRGLVKETDRVQIVILFALVYIYFMFAHTVRMRTLHPFIISLGSTPPFLIFLVNFFLVIGFFTVLSQWLGYKTTVTSLVFSFAYSLIPTLIWFFTTSFLFLLVPPPRTASNLGLSFSLVFTAFSVMMLLWRIQLLYLSLRFATKAPFYRLVYLMFLFGLWFIPYSYLMYYLGIFRVPFI